MLRSAATAIAIAGGLFAVIGCGGDDEDESSKSENGGDGDITLGDGGDGDGTGNGEGGIDGCTASFSDGDCTGLEFEGENIPLDIYIMFDQSLSMGCQIEASRPWGDWCCGDQCAQRIDPVRQAVDQFLNDPASGGITVGIGFFGNMQVGETSCDASDYSDAAVDMGILPDHAPAVLAALGDVSPTGETPTTAAIEGACSYIGQWHEQQPLHKKVILLVTDGVPEAPSTADCNPSIDEAAAAAAGCLQGEPQVPTYVLGVGQALDNLNQIAQAGGTEQAYLVDSNVETSVLQALNAIRSDAVIPCTLTIPQPMGAAIDYEQVNVGICDAGGQTLYTYFVEDPASCENGAWYYEDSGGEQVVQLCDQTCETVSAAGSSLILSVGCDTVTRPVR